MAPHTFCAGLFLFFLKGYDTFCILCRFGEKPWAPGGARVRDFWQVLAPGDIFGRLAALGVGRPPPPAKNYRNVVKSNLHISSREVGFEDYLPI